MVASRTGTTSHLRFRRAVLAAGKAGGVTHCPVPGCGVWLDYDTSRKPNSAEPDHIVRVADGGTDDVTNGRVICRRCNQRLGQQRPTTSPSRPRDTDTRPQIDW